MAATILYVTTKDRQEAATIGRALVESRLAACANILDGMESIYRWQGKVEEARETVLIVKTTEAQYAAACELIKAHHSYECPCIVALPITAGNPAYLQWIEQMVK